MKSLTHHFDLQGNLRQPNGMEVVFASYEETERDNFRRRSNYSADLWLFHISIIPAGFAFGR